MIDLRLAFDMGGRTAIVTGASSGLGAVFATALASAGANVVLADRRAEGLDEVAAAIAGLGGGAEPVACDVTDAGEVSRLVDVACGRFGGLDVMVAAAGSGGDPGAPGDLPAEVLFERVMRVSLLGAWLCFREAGARMLRRGSGSIVGVSPVGGLGGLPCLAAAHRATGAAIANLARTLAVTWAGRGVRVNVLAPGWFGGALAAPPIDEADVDRILPGIPAARPGRRDELTGALLFLASEMSGYVTGQTLAVDGGVAAGADAAGRPPLPAGDPVRSGC
ncbi:MAG: SDR family NAD(P)-dependent oxidoreductase [Thermoleophilia bacterium]